MIGEKIHPYGTIPSTMDEAHRLAANGEPEGSVVIAEAQTRGRGRLGRSWVSPREGGAYLSVILRPSIGIQKASRLTLMAAVAAARAVEEVTGLRPEIKWPNDLLIQGRKVAGILAELHASGGRIHHAVVGIGINVNTPKALLPAHGTSLSEEKGSPVDRAALVRALLRALDAAYERLQAEEFAGLLDEWRRYAAFLGRRVRVMAEGRIVDGWAVDVDPNGALLVRTDVGFTEAVSAGEVLIVR